MRAIKQLPLPLDSQNLAAANLIVRGACNQAALTIAEADPNDWPTPVVAITGAPASGKTLFAEIWAHRQQAGWCAAAELNLKAAHELGACMAVVVDGLDALANEEALFHLHNAVVGQGGRLLLTARVLLTALPIKLPDLRTRLRATNIVEIEPPDDIFLEELMCHLAERRQIALPEKVAAFCLLRMERSTQAALQLVEALDRQSLASQGPVSIEVASRALAELVSAKRV